MLSVGIYDVEICMRAGAVLDIFTSDLKTGGFVGLLREWGVAFAKPQKNFPWNRQHILRDMLFREHGGVRYTRAERFFLLNMAQRVTINEMINWAARVENDIFMLRSVIATSNFSNVAPCCTYLYERAEGVLQIWWHILKSVKKIGFMLHLIRCYGRNSR